MCCAGCSEQPPACAAALHSNALQCSQGHPDACLQCTPARALQDKLTAGDADVTWAMLADRLQDAPAALFDSCIWPALATAGWTCAESQAEQQHPGQQAPCAAAGTASPRPSRHSYHPPQRQATESCPGSGSSSSTAQPPGACDSPAAVLRVLRASGQCAPDTVVQQLRHHEYDVRLAACIAASNNPAAPHRHPGKPDGRLTNTPNCQRNIVSAHDRPTAWSSPFRGPQGSGLGSAAIKRALQLVR